MAVAMESNPETMNRYLQRLGVSNKWKIVDVMGLDADALTWIPRPVLAVILLFPLSNNYEAHKTKQENELSGIGQTASDDVFYLKQAVGNICGTIALVHCVANNIQYIELEDGLLKNYLNDAKGLDAAARGALLENSAAILDAYKNIVHADSDQGAETDESNSNHFITFIHKDGTLYELDGRKSLPISHGSTTPETLLEDASKVCREFIDREPDSIGFNMVALVPAL